MIPKNKELIFLNYLKDNEHEFLTTKWPLLVYEIIKEEYSIINDYMLFLSNCDYISSTHYHIKMTEKGKKYLKKIEERLFWNER